MANRFLAWYRRYYLLLNIPVLLLLTEVVLVVVDPVHSGPTDLDTALTRLETHPPGAGPTILLLGNSGIRLGIDEDELERALGAAGHPARVYNFGLVSGRIDDAVSAAKLVVSGKLHPTIAVIGVNPFLVDDRINPDSLLPWVKRRSPYLFFYRSILRGRIKKILRRHVADTEIQGFARDVGVETFLHEFAHRSVEDFTLLDQLPELITWLRGQGVETYAIVLPMSADGTKRLDNYAVLMKALRDRVPPNSLDLAEAYPPEAFKDVGHLSAAGDKDMTSKVATWLAALPELHHQ